MCILDSSSIFNLEKWKTNAEFNTFILNGSENFDKNDKLDIAIACLMTYIQDNFTGPDVTPIQLGKVFEEKLKCSDRIVIDGIEFNENMRNIPLLLIARSFLNSLTEAFPDDLVS